MTHPDAVKWNRRYRIEGAAWLNNAPNGLMVRYEHLLPTQGLGLDVAAGVGVNSVYLSGRGLHMIALDISEVGLCLAQSQARRHFVHIDVAVVDLANVWLPRSHFDVILNFRYLGRASLPALRDALKPGGLILFEAFLSSEPKGQRSGHFLKPDELRGVFQGWDTIHRSLATTSGPDKRRPRTTEQMVARKPTH